VAASKIATNKTKPAIFVSSRNDNRFTKTQIRPRGNYQHTAQRAAIGDYLVLPGEVGEGSFGTNSTPTARSDRQTIRHRRCTRAIDDSNRIKWSGKVEAALVASRAPVREMSLTTHDPSTVPSA
jgi:hypothetical protein